MPEWLPYLLATAIGLIIGASVWLAKVAWPFVQKLSHFVDDVVGESARPGVEARPGLMERIGGLETQVETIHHETTPNHGGSIKDEMRRVEYLGIQTAKALDAHVEQTAKWNQMLTELHDQWSSKPRNQAHPPE